MCLVLFTEYRDLNANYPYPEHKCVQETHFYHKDQVQDYRDSNGSSFKHKSIQGPNYKKARDLIAKSQGPDCKVRGPKYYFGEVQKKNQI